MPSRNINLGLAPHSDAKSPSPANAGNATAVLDSTGPNYRPGSLDAAIAGQGIFNTNSHARGVHHHHNTAALPDGLPTAGPGIPHHPSTGLPNVTPPHAQQHPLFEPNATPPGFARGPKTPLPCPARPHDAPTLVAMPDPGAPHAPILPTATAMPPTPRTTRTTTPAAHLP
eukprot:7241478-Prymnesium_polylepis.1